MSGALFFREGKIVTRLPYRPCLGKRHAVKVATLASLHWMVPRLIEDISNSNSIDIVNSLGLHRGVWGVKIIERLQTLSSLCAVMGLYTRGRLRELDQPPLFSAQGSTLHSLSVFHKAQMPRKGDRWRM